MSLSRRNLIRVVVAALIIAFFVFRDQLPEIELEELIKDLSRSLGEWTYLLVGGLAFLETGAFVGLVAPGEFTVILGGAVAGQGEISLPLILGIAWLAAFLGDSVSFLLGAKLGRGFLIRHGERVRISEARLRQVESYFDRHGGKTILVGRFIGIVRALAPFIAGSGGMRYGAFAPYSVLGTGLWATALILVGYFASSSLDEVANLVGQGLILFGIFVGVIVGAILLNRHLRVPENRERIVREMERRRPLRPLLVLARRLRPQARFVWARLTPGGLGLELTTLLAVLAVGLYFLIAHWSIVGGNPDPTRADEALLDVADDIRTAWLNDGAEGVTTLGSAYVVFPLVGVAAAGLALLRRWAELAVLLLGVAIIVGLSDSIKEWTDRPRPEGGLTEAQGSSFPSRHASYATVYVWLAATLAFRVVPGITRRSLLIAAGLLVAGMVGLTRVYLRVHWLSDVTAGWALGVSAFAAVAAVALVATHIRQNQLGHERDRDRAGRRAAAARDRA
jgi:undecaprenyl-diphosphatase